MRRNLHALIRAALLANPDGMTKGKLTKAVNAQLGTVLCAVRAMPDVYIDRWIQRPGCRAEAVHVAVEVPQDCPPPDPAGRRWQSRGSHQPSQQEQIQ